MLNWVVFLQCTFEILTKCVGVNCNLPYIKRRIYHETYLYPTRSSNCLLC
ncbi:hypothetical protein [Moraxella lacunata]